MSKETEIKRLKYQIELMKCCDNCELDAVSCAGECSAKQYDSCRDCDYTLNNWVMIDKKRITGLHRMKEQRENELRS